MARVVAVLLGYDGLPGATLTRYCSSALQTTRMAFHAIKAGEGDVFLSAGVEMVSRFAKGNSDSLPDTMNARQFADAKARTDTFAAGGQTWTDPRDGGAVPDIYMSMGQTAENLAQAKGISREDMDEFGVRSQNLAEKAIANGFWAREITPVTLPDGTVVSNDDGPRAGVTLEGVSGLKPVFRPDGRVTAGNCCPLNDGAAALVIMSGEKAARARAHPARPRSSRPASPASRPRSWASARSRRRSRRWPTPACPSSDIDLVEINEAFAAQVIPSYQDLGIPLDKLNVNGGAIAVGHPFGMTGARITGTLHQQPAVPRQAVRAGDHVRRRRPGHGHGDRAPQLELSCGWIVPSRGTIQPHCVGWRRRGPVSQRCGPFTPSQGAKDRSCASRS